MTATNDLLATLNAVHAYELARFHYLDDKFMWNKVEHWEEPDQIPDEGPLIGDCDAFTLACRKAVRKLGLPNRLVYCKVNSGGRWQHHLVLEVKGWILCNLQEAVVAQNSEACANYHFEKISGYEAGEPWLEIIG